MNPLHLKDLAPPSTTTSSPTPGQQTIAPYASAATDAVIASSKRRESTKTAKITRHGIIHELLLVPIILCLLFYSIILFMT